MNQPGHPPVLITLLFIALFAWTFYRRMRRSIGRQRLYPARPWTSVVIFPLFTALLLPLALGNPLSLAALLGSAAVGVGLGIYGLRLTQFEATPGALYYTPSAHIGIALSLLLVARIAYRFLVSGLFPSAAGAPPQAAAFGPLTLLFFGPVAGYYTTYAIGLLRWRYSVTATTQAAQPADPQG